eukprot:3078353-Alexandrium_andersonii.AAC.1
MSVLFGLPLLLALTQLSTMLESAISSRVAPAPTGFAFKPEPRLRLWPKRLRLKRAAWPA